jgi:hypothetical protein
MQLNHSTEVSVLLPQSTSTAESVPLLHKFKNSVTVKIELMHSKPLTNNHYHFPIIAELVTSHMSDQEPKQEDGRSPSIWRKQLLLLCLACVLCVCVRAWGGCIVMLKAYTFWQTVCLSGWSNTCKAAGSIVMRNGKWLFIMTVNARIFSQNGINASMCSGTTLRHTIITLQRNRSTSFVRIWNDLAVIQTISSTQHGSKTTYVYSFSSPAHTWVISDTISYLHMELCVIFNSYLNK